MTGLFVEGVCFQFGIFRTSGLPGLDMMPPDAFPDQFPLPPRDDAEMLDLDAVLAREAGDQVH